jgi:hypothetical protein
MQFPVTLQFKPSRRLRAALVFAHALALLAVVLLSADYVTLFLIFPAVPILIGSLIWTWRTVETPFLILKQDGLLQWRTVGSEDCPGQLLGGTVFSWLVVIRIRLESAGSGRTKVLIALADSLSPNDFRRLQVWLRWVLPVRPAEKSAEEP